jgi:hypothetical protein
MEARCVLRDDLPVVSTISGRRRFATALAIRMSAATADPRHGVGAVDAISMSLSNRSAPTPIVNTGIERARREHLVADFGIYGHPTRGSRRRTHRFCCGAVVIVADVFEALTREPLILDSLPKRSG